MFPPISPQLKLSQMASIRNGEIPVVVVYFQPSGAPREYKLLGPEEAVELLVVIERLKEMAARITPSTTAEQISPINSEGETDHAG